MTPRPVVLFADRVPPLVGGVETHAGYFIEHFTAHPRFPLVAIVGRDGDGQDRVMHGSTSTTGGELAGRIAALAPAIVFFNSGRWIEDLRALRRAIPAATFVYRTGGNEILKAPLERAAIDTHVDRQAFWASALNDTIDLLITNSAFTERRLRGIGVACRFLRCVGGVDNLAVAAASPGTPSDLPVWCCAARFVPYKNHRLLVEVVAALRRRGHGVSLRLVGGGPLLPEVRAQVRGLGLDGSVTFLGELANRDVCREIAAADAYVQFSGDQVTTVPGGSYVHSEGMGRSILEALAAGTFVIAGRSGALPEVVTVDRGVLVELDSPDAVADAIAPLMEAGIPRLPPLRDYGWPALFANYERYWNSHAAPGGH